jgi:hypothetical protein
VLADHFEDADRRGKHGHGSSRIEWLAGLEGLDPLAASERVVADEGFASSWWPGRRRTRSVRCVR